MSQYPKHDKLVKSASLDAKAGVHEEPMGSNSGPRVRVYQRATWLGGTGWPWCCAFFVYHAAEAGFALPYKGAGAYAWLEWAKRAGWSVPLSSAVPGDAVVFNIGSGHLAILLERKGLMVKTCDGNVSDRVDTRIRSVSLVRGAIHIPENLVKPPKPPRVPPFEVVGSASGHKRVIFNGKASTIGKKLPRFLRRNPSITIRRKKNNG